MTSTTEVSSGGAMSGSGSAEKATAVGMASPSLVGSFGPWTVTPPMGAAGRDAAHTGRVVPDLPLWNQFYLIGAGNPAVVSSILDEADTGHMRRFCDLFHESRERDGTLHDCMTILETDISGLSWEAMPQAVKAQPRRAEIKLAKQINAAIKEMFGWTDMLAHLTGESEAFGHATSELIWKPYEGINPLLRNTFTPTAVENIQCRRFGFELRSSRLLFDSAAYGEVNFQGVDLMKEYPAGKFIQHRPRINGDVPVREGLARLLIWLALYRNWDLKDWLLLAEIGWKPYRIATWKRDQAGGPDEAFAYQIVDRLISSGGVAKPDTIDLAIEWPKTSTAGQQSQHRELAEWLGQEISKALLGHTQVTEVGNKGARSASEVGIDVAKARRKARALALAVTLNAHFVIPFCQMNAPGVRPPILVPDLDDKVDLPQLAKAVKDLSDSGLEISAGWVREEVGMPTPEPGEEMLGGTTREEPTKQELNGKPKQKPGKPEPGKPGASGKPNGNQRPQPDKMPPAKRR